MDNFWFWREFGYLVNIIDLWEIRCIGIGFTPKALGGQATLWGKMVHRRAAEITENAQSNLWRDVE